MKKTITFGLNIPTRKPSARIRRSTLGSTGASSDADERTAVAKRLHAEEHEVGGAGELDHGVGGDRLLHERAETERDRDDLHVDAGRVADDGRDAGAAPERQRARHDEQHARPRDEDQHEREEDEGQQVLGRQHAIASVPAARDARPSAVRTDAPGALDSRASALGILNHMVQYPQIDRALAALADPTRRAILERLGRGSATITELAEPFGISLTGMKKHVRVLEDAELVTTEKVGRARQCSLGPRRLDDVQEWIEMYRRMLDERLDRFGELLERTNQGDPR